MRTMNRAEPLYSSMGGKKTAFGNLTKTPKPQTAAETRQNKSEPNDTSEHQKQDLEEDQNPECSAQKKTNRREEREKGSRGLIPVHVNSKHSSDCVGFLEQSIKRPSKNKQLPFNTGLLQY